MKPRGDVGGSRYVGEMKPRGGVGGSRWMR